MDRLAALLRTAAADPRPDGPLLAAFLADRDEAAFAELVRRHAPLVWGVCRRALPDAADAEDAFQATFLILVRRARGLADAPTVGPWLFRVAAWTARNARRKNARRLARFVPLPDDVPAPPQPPGSTTTDLDAAVSALSERCRAAVLLCHLEGLTHREAAARLGCAAGTVASLVSRGLAKLRARLAGRDPLAVLATLGVAAPAGVTAAVVRSAAASRLASLSVAASPAVAALTRGVIRMFWVKNATAAGFAAAVLLAAGVGIGMSARQSDVAVGQEKPVGKTEGPSAPLMPKPATGENPPLEGHWELIATESQGEKKEFPQGSGIELVVRGDVFILISTEQSILGGTAVKTSEYQHLLLPPLAGKPLEIDINNSNPLKPSWKRGIITLTRDQVVICWGGWNNTERPTAFATKAGSPNVMNVFKRIAPASETNAAPPRGELPGTGVKTAEKATPFVVLTVRGEDRERSPYTITEFDAAGKPRWSVLPAVDLVKVPRDAGQVYDLKDPRTQHAVTGAIRDYLTRLKTDPDAPHDLRVVFRNDVSLGGFPQTALEACVEAGFESIRFTGYLPSGGFIPKLAPGPDGEAVGYTRYKGDVVNTKKLLGDYKKAMVSF